MALMLLPFFFGLIFFFLSAILALIKVNDTNLPDNFKEIQIRIEDYKLEGKNIDTGKREWVLTAISAESDADQNIARVQEPYVEYFDETDEERLLYTIKADYGVFNKALKTIELYDNIILINLNSGYEVKAGFMSFSDSDDKIKVQSKWILNSPNEFQMSAEKGLISKDLKSILGKGETKLIKDNIELRAEKIFIEPDSNKNPIEAEGSAVLNIANTTSLKAEFIEISKSGQVLAKQDIEVTSTDMKCYSQNLKILTDKNKEPIKAVFTGNPRIIQEGTLIFADLITYDFKSKLASVEGNVHSQNN